MRQEAQKCIQNLVSYLTEAKQKNKKKQQQQETEAKVKVKMIKKLYT